MTPRSYRVVSVPAGHPYPEAVRAEATAELVVLADPDPAWPDRPAAGVWWPHRGLEPWWLDQQEFDLLHLHFGFDHRSPAQLGELVGYLRATGRPLVLTVHDLRSPHQADSAVLDRQLDVLVPAADAVLTLTPWAATQIGRRWGRGAMLSPHPPLVPSTVSRRLREARRDRHLDRRRGRRLDRGAPQHPVVAVSCKSLRPNCDPARLLPALDTAVRRSGARLRLLVHREVMSSQDPATRAAAAALARARDRGADLVEHEPLSDAALWSELATQDVAVLPYRFGTHSGWLEACHDVGTHVAAPSFGGYADQGADALYQADDHGLDEESLVTAVVGLVNRARSGALAGDPAERARRRPAAARVHERVYGSLLAEQQGPGVPAGAQVAGCP